EAFAAAEPESNTGAFPETASAWPIPAFFPPWPELNFGSSGFAAPSGAPEAGEIGAGEDSASPSFRRKRSRNDFMGNFFYAGSGMNGEYTYCNRQRISSLAAARPANENAT